ncbi:MAG TPA: winged helix-turn-helix domain-containing protein [Burkholderiaceae bacterium]|nr:winged helix-turn-helix domain-containing protein [Burkholderiaceae bacterium]
MHLPLIGDHDATGHAMMRFDRFTLDTTRGCLLDAGQQVALRPKTYLVLHYLLSNPGRLLSRREIVDAVWPDVIVTDDSLAHCISEIRSAIGDGQHRVIKTIHKRGYLFATRVLLDDGAQATSEAKRPPKAASRLPAWPALRPAVIAGAAVALLFALVRGDRPLKEEASGSNSAASIAVLPFASVARGGPGDGLNDGIAEDLIASLSRFSGLFVIARGSSFRYRPPGVDERRVGRELGVQYVVEGSISHDVDRLSITAALVDARTGVQLWTQAYQSEASGLPAAQVELAQRIATTLVANVSQAEISRVLHRPMRAPVAYDLYLKAKTELRQVNEGTRDARLNHLVEARRLLRESLAVDANYEPAMTALSQAYVFGWCERISEEFHQPSVLAQALRTAQQAVVANHRSAEAHSQLSWVLHLAGRHDEAMAEFRQALGQNPNLADGRLGLMLAVDGHAQEAVDFIKRVMRLDPYHDPAYFVFLAIAYFVLHDDENSLAMQRLAQARVPENFWGADAWRAAAAARAGERDLAKDAVAHVLQRNPQFRVARFVERELANRADQQQLALALYTAGLP